MICERCARPIDVGDWPFCPHGRGMSNVIGDECDIVQENGFREPRRFRSKAELKRALAERGLEVHACNAGDHDKLVARWSSVDLEAATALVQFRPHTPPPPSPNDMPVVREADVPITWTIQELPS